MSHFLKIAITLPEFFPGETERIRRILESGEVDIVHLRKPGWPAEQMRELICNLPCSLHPKLKLHDHFQLLAEFDLGGVHLNSRNPVVPENAQSVSRSVHSFEQLEEWKHYEYMTLSPIFDSITKKDYRSAFRTTDLAKNIPGKRVVALGGVTPAHFPLLEKLGFIGAAMMGSIWNQTVRT